MLLAAFPLQKHAKMNLSDKHEIMKYLHKFGYLDSMEQMTDGKMKQAIMDYQYFMGLDSTHMGEMDPATLDKMNMPRCGRPDKFGMHIQRLKRYSFLGNQTWTKNLLTYRVNKYTTKLPAGHVDAELSRAVEMWKQYSKIKLKPAQKNEKVDISIMFDYIDDEGGIVGFALNPPQGVIYLDEYETWTSNSRNGVDLFQLAVHEIGHSLGLDHSDNQEAVMFPLYYYRPYFSLHKDDILGMKMLYKVGYPVPPPSKFKNNNVLCQNTTIDAIFQSTDGAIYILKDDKYWELSTNFFITEGPRFISEKWPEIPNNLDSAFTDLSGLTYFFKGTNYWVYSDKMLKAKRAKVIQDGFRGIPDDIDSVLSWSGDGKIYFFKDELYWAFDTDKPASRQVSRRYPRPTSDWQGVPSIFEAAISINGSTYFFQNEMYYKFDDMKRKVDDGYPKSVVIDLLACVC